MKNLNWIAKPLPSAPVNHLVKQSLVAALLFSSSACVTVNVNIPEGDIQQASDNYVKSLYEAKQKGNEANAIANTAATPSSAPKIKIDSPKAKEIGERMKARRESNGSVITAQKQAGVLGEANNGKLVIKGKTPPNWTPAELENLKKLIADENKDRTDLYQEIIKLNGLSKKNSVTFEQHFSKSFVNRSPSHTWIQDEDGNWYQKE